MNPFGIDGTKEQGQYTYDFTVADAVFKENERVTKHFQTYRKFRVTGIGYKLSRRQGPVWAPKDGSANSIFPYSYIIPRDIDTATYICANTTNDPWVNKNNIKHFEDFINWPSAVHYNTYGDKTINIYSKNPVFELACKYDDEDPIHFYDLVNSDNKRYQWFRCEECFNNRLIVYIGPTIWLRDNTALKGHEWDLEINIYFKFFDNSIY